MLGELELCEDPVLLGELVLLLESELLLTELLESELWALVVLCEDEL